MFMPPPDHKTRKTRKSLSADALYALVKSSFEKIPDHRDAKATVALADVLMSAFAMFSLKDPSLLAFDARRNDANMRGLFGIAQIPSDSSMRESLDPVDPEHFRVPFKDVFRQLQRGKALEPFVFHQGCYLLALDGTGYFSSEKIHCDSCLEKVNKKTGEVTYQHQMLAAAIVHPDRQEVIPLACEPIRKQDGSSKNDCERNAGKRLLRKIRQDHPRLGLIVVEDGLASNAPHVRELLKQRMHFFLGVKPGDHAFLFERLIEAFDQGRATVISWKDGERDCEVAWVNQLPLNESNQNLLVNVLQYSEYDEQGQRRKHFSWISDLKIGPEVAFKFSRGARSRWKIENETFNTLKNQGYHYEHNYGHGKQNLCVVFAMLMLLAFLVDQVQQLCCALFRAVWSKLGSKRCLWEQLRSHFYHFTFQSMEHLYEVILHDLAKEIPAPTASAKSTLPSCDTS
jgi:hypothetical protein